MPVKREMAMMKAISVRMEIEWITTVTTSFERISVGVANGCETRCLVRLKSLAGDEFDEPEIKKLIAGSLRDVNRFYRTL